MLKLYRDHLLFIVFCDKSNFCANPDNQCYWMLNDDFREEMCAKYEKQYGHQLATGSSFRGKNYSRNIYRNFVDKSNMFALLKIWKDETTSNPLFLR